MLLFVMFLSFLGPEMIVEPSAVPSPGMPESPVPTPRRQQPVPTARVVPNEAMGPRERFGCDYLSAALNAG